MCYTLEVRGYKRSMMWKYRKSTITFFVLLPFIISLMIVGLISDITASDIARFFFFFFSSLICGYALLNANMVYSWSICQQIAISSGIGYALHIINYFILSSFGLKPFLVYLFMIETIISIIYLLFKEQKNSKIQYNINNKEMGLFFFFVTFVLLLKILLNICNELPSNSNFTNIFPYNNDTMFQAENTISAKYEFPIMNMRWMGEKLYYHYFTSIYNAVTSIATNISVAKLELELIPLQAAFFLFISFYSLVEYMVVKYSARALVLFIFSFTAGFEYYASVTWVSHIYLAPFGFDMGLAMLLLAIILVSQQLEDGKFNLCTYLMSMVFIAVSTGCKGPVMIIGGVYIGIQLLLGRLNKQNRYIIIYAIGFTVSFFIVYILIITNFGKMSENNSASVLMGNWFASLKSYEVGEVYRTLKERNVPEVIALFSLLVSWIFCMQPSIFIMLVVFGVFIIWKKLKCKYMIIDTAPLLFSYLASILFICFTKQDGASEMYFVLAAYPFIMIFTAKLYDFILCSTESIIASYGRRLLTIVLFCCLLLGTMLFIRNTKPYLLRAHENLSYNDTGSREKCNPGAVSLQEMEAYMWINENTSFSDVLITNLFLREGQEANFTTSVFTERYLWLDAWDYTRNHDTEIDCKRQVLQKCYTNENSALRQIIREGVTYMICIKSITENFSLNSQYGYEVYSNEEVIIFKLMEKK